MSESKQNLGITPPPIYTLEKNGTIEKSELNSDSVVTMQGTGTSEDTVRSWVEKKYKANHIADALMQVAEEAEEWEWYSRYSYTKHKCLDNITLGEERVFGHYCKKPWCPICLAIRKATLINQYFPAVKHWTLPTFVTLTAQAHKHEELSVWFNTLDSALSRILNTLKKRYDRRGEEKFMCLVCIECCFNPIAQTYNPHYHIITSNYAQGRELREEWMKSFSRKQVHPVAQYIDVVKDKEKNLIEVIKYGAKILTDSEMKKGKERVLLPYIYAAALHEINKVFHNRKLIRKRGFKIEKQSKKTEKTIVSDLESLTYDDFVRTWVNEITGEAFTPTYIPNQNLETIYEQNIDLIKR